MLCEALKSRQFVHDSKNEDSFGKTPKKEINIFSGSTYLIHVLIELNVMSWVTKWYHIWHWRTPPSFNPLFFKGNLKKSKCSVFFCGSTYLVHVFLTWTWCVESRKGIKNTIDTQEFIPLFLKSKFEEVKISTVFFSGSTYPVHVFLIWTWCVES